MSEYVATISWRRGDDDFTGNAYSRAHEWRFDGGLTVPASSSPGIVPLPMSVAAHVDPEEAFVASLSSCHMLFFLSLAAKRGIVVDEYTDEASGIMQKNEDGRIAMTRVVLRPKAAYEAGTAPDREQLEKLHHHAHELCFIANSVRTEVVTEIVA
ncbi:MAG: OsmC family protein [Gammaproteobacteria bacterium]|nr:OsmC family protein [Gammaproteobacteria bacterium]